MSKKSEDTLLRILSYLAVLSDFWPRAIADVMAKGLSAAAATFRISSIVALKADRDENVGCDAKCRT